MKERFLQFALICLSSLVFSDGEARILGSANPSRCLQSSSLSVSVDRWSQYVEKLILSGEVPSSIVNSGLRANIDPVEVIHQWVASRASKDLAMSIHLKVLNALRIQFSSDDSKALQSTLNQFLEIYANGMRLKGESVKETAPLFPESFIPMATLPGNQELRDFKFSRKYIRVSEWADIMGSSYRHGWPPISLDQALDLPVEVTWASAAIFANRLSEIQGYQPVYDFTHTVFDSDTSAEAGNLKMIAGICIIRWVSDTPGKPMGYRLPAGNEMNHIASNLGIFRVGEESTDWINRQIMRVQADFVFSDFIKSETFVKVARIIAKFRPKPDFNAGYDVAGQIIEEFRKPDLCTWTSLSFISKTESKASIDLSDYQYMRASTFGAPNLNHFQGDMRGYYSHPIPAPRDGKEAPFCLCGQCQYWGLGGQSSHMNTKANLRLVLMNDSGL